jgi:hypothetical protein
MDKAPRVDRVEGNPAILPLEWAAVIPLLLDSSPAEG